MISLAGKAALITGGSRGIGAAAVKLFAQAGADVVFNYVKAKDAAIQVQQEAGKHGTRVEAFKADVGKHADNQKLVEHTIARLGRLDILVANAGVWNFEDLPIEKMTEKQWDDMIRINLKSVYSIIHFTVPHMIKQKSGKIIPISSTAGQRGESLHPTCPTPCWSPKPARRWLPPSFLSVALLPQKKLPDRSSLLLRTWPTS